MFPLTFVLLTTEILLSVVFVVLEQNSLYAWFLSDCGSTVILNVSDIFNSNSFTTHNKHLVRAGWPHHHNQWHWQTCLSVSSLLFLLFEHTESPGLILRAITGRCCNCAADAARRSDSQGRPRGSNTLRCRGNTFSDSRQALTSPAWDWEWLTQKSLGSKTITLFYKDVLRIRNNNNNSYVKAKNTTFLNFFY